MIWSFFKKKYLHLRISNGSMEIVLRGLWEACHCFLGFPVSHLISSTSSSPLPTSISDAFNSTGGWTYLLFVVCMFPYMKVGPSKHHRQQQHTWLLLSGLLIYCCGGENAKSMQNQSFHIYIPLITFALWELSILLLCVCAIALGMGTRTLHDKYSPVTCSRCAVIGNMICASRENWWRPAYLWWDSLSCFCCAVHLHRCRKSKGALSQCASLTPLEHPVL